MVEEPVAVELKDIEAEVVEEEPVAVEFMDTEAETDAVLAKLEELELVRDSTVAKVMPAAKRLVELSMEE